MSRSRVGIILYVNRSGSTLLSRMVSDAFSDVYVFPELRFTLELLVALRRGIGISRQTLKQMILQDVRIEALRIEEATISRICDEYGDQDFHGLMEALATAALGRKPAAIILKLESYVDFIPELDKAFNDPVLIHALRDPRAVAKSMRATPIPEKPGFDMARGSYVFAARHWRDYIQKVSAISRNHRVLTARFECLHDPDASIIDEIGLALNIVRSENAGRYVVAAIDSVLHPLVGEPVDPRRSASWRHDLNPHDVRVIESICGEQMVVMGYAPVGRASSIEVNAAYMKHRYAMIRHAVRTGIFYLRRKRNLAVIVHRLRLARAARGRSG